MKSAEERGRTCSRVTTTIPVEGMTCGHRERPVEEALRGVSGVTDATVDREGDQARVDGEAAVAALVQAVEDAEHTDRVREQYITFPDERPAVLLRVRPP